VTQATNIPVQTTARVSAHLRSFTFDVPTITDEMRVGVKPPSNVSAKIGDGHVILVHGYCSSTNPWEQYSSDWTNAKFFLNPSSNIANKEFAEKIAAYCAANGLQKYSIVGHSQGGMAGLHLFNYYFSGIDDAKDGHKIQSLGTPYKGCSAAGSAANLAKLFGVGCGQNTDLSTDGAVLWLNGITTEHRKEVYYYTTTYEQGTFFGDYCNIVMNFVLEWPNDGTTELGRAELPQGNGRGNTQKYCHTTGMKYTAQYYNRQLSQKMNAEAAR